MKLTTTSTAEFKYKWSFTSTPPNSFIKWCLIKYREGQLYFTARVSKLFIPTGRIDYCGLVRGPAVGSGIADRLNYCGTFVVHTSFTDVVAGRIIQGGGARVVDPCFTAPVLDEKCKIFISVFSLLLFLPFS